MTTIMTRTEFGCLVRVAVIERRARLLAMTGGALETFLDLLKLECRWAEKLAVPQEKLVHLFGPRVADVTEPDIEALWAFRLRREE